MHNQTMPAAALAARQLYQHPTTIHHFRGTPPPRHMSRRPPRQVRRRLLVGVGREAISNRESREDVVCILCRWLGRVGQVLLLLSGIARINLSTRRPGNMSGGFEMQIFQRVKQGSKEWSKQDGYSLGRFG
jgi:hypothetical protein